LGRQMPVFPEIEVETAQWCNLRQALQWLRYETRPVDPVYEPLFAITDDLPSGSRKEKAALWAAMCAGRIRLFGRPGFGEFSADDEPDIAWFGRYGRSELVPIARLIEAGFDGLNFYRSRLGKITEWGDRCPSAGWEFSQLTIPTAELLSTFPAKSDPFTPAPPPIIAPPAREAASTPTLLPPQTILFLGEAIDRVETRTSADPWDAAIAVHRALCSGELVALSDREEVIPRGVWRSAAPMDLTERRRGH